MTKFKVGDKVRVIVKHEDLPYGTEGVVCEPHYDGLQGGNVRVRSGLRRETILGDHLEHVTETTPPKQTKSQRIAALEAEAQRQDEMLKASQDRILDLERKVAELQRKVSHKLVYDKLTEEAIEKAPKSPNEQRKAIIAEAKAFVAHWEPICATKVTFEINAEKRTVVALRHRRDNGRVFDKGIAKAHPDDVFNADIGKAIALGRALGLDVKRFEKAVQPTEFAQGHYIRYYGSIQKITQLDGERARVNTGGFHWTSRVDEEGYVIIDDTEAQY